jgi:very-short-patch-repair endonuclease
MENLHYPVVKVAKHFVGGNWKKVEIEHVPCPVKPKPPLVKNIIQGSILSYIFPVGIIILGVACGEGTLGMGVFTFSGFLLLVMWLAIFVNPREERITRENETQKSEYDQMLKKYSILLNEYEQREKLIDELERLQKSDKDSSRLDALNILFSQRPILIQEASIGDPYFTVAKGVSERGFFQKLVNEFGDKVLIDKKVGKYFPDFMYADSDNRVYINIEVDEPYVFSTGKPIHCIGDDDERDDFFNSMNCTVLRFSEYQVVHHSISCVKLIRSIIEMKEKGTNRYQLYSLRDKRWTKRDAETFSDRQLREYYLNKYP